MRMHVVLLLVVLHSLVILHATAERRHKNFYACKLHRRSITHPLPSVCYVLMEREVSKITCSVACNFWWSNVKIHMYFMFLIFHRWIQLTKFPDLRY